MKSKWGAVSQKGRLTLDTHLPDIPHELAEYVIVHELVHFLATHHGKLFESFLFALPAGLGRQAIAVAGMRQA